MTFCEPFASLTEHSPQSSLRRASLLATRLGKRKLLRFVLSGCTWKNGQLGFEYRKPFDLIAEFERAEKTRKQKTQHSNRSGDQAPARGRGGDATESQGLAPISIAAGKRGTQGQTAQNEIWLLR